MTAPHNLHTRALRAVADTITAIALEMQVNRHQVRDWLRRGRVPPIHWARLVERAEANGFVVSERRLAADRRAARRGSI